MNRQIAKEFILNHWKTSSGKRITEMLLKYKPYFFEKMATKTMTYKDTKKMFSKNGEK